MTRCHVESVIGVVVEGVALIDVNISSARLVPIGMIGLPPCLPRVHYTTLFTLTTVPPLQLSTGYPGTP